MKPIYASNFPYTTPDEADFAAVEAALQELLKPLALQLGIKFIKRLRKWLKLHTLPKHCLLQQEDQVPVGVYFLLSGSVLVGTDLKGYIQIDHILRTGDFILPLKLFSASRSILGMKIAEPVRLLFIDTRRYKLMLKKFPETAVLTNLWRDKLEIDDFSRKRELQTMNALERLSWLYDKWPDCFIVFSDYWIGSYLGLNRETVCRNKLKVIKKRKKP
ncbi:Crp/Fnr family transcriptional regulator [Pedobacter nyackensis]|uniref:cAMP-binding domain of CRP or a regulatory subunit of cAMP-dependent protein kinases n=1 Tax=Pedobacter nyackensis TaxID=475255 RepID=A0A1W2DVC2_9SPHI|nr:Crp/Fnr family transcriptional regulator [Pedobacter nyackensis]SMD01297.1 cAMP-binding domain of CRP or a regulatory subunit of cAMP-dependent protein kinases [Pedobacter nyackensis]